MNALKRIFGAPAKTATVRLQPSNLTLTVNPKQTILNAALEQNIAYPHHCRVGSCGTCKTKLIEGEVRELTDKSYTLNAKDIEAGYILACQSVPKTDLVLEVRRLVSKQGQGALPPGPPQKGSPF